MGLQENRFNTDSSVDGAMLRREYESWLRSQVLSAAASDVLDGAGQPAARASVVLENALMYLLLDDAVADPRTLWPRLDVEACAIGLGEVGISDPALARSLLAALREALAAPLGSPSLDLRPEFLSESLRFGRFVLPRNRWVDDAWWHVASTVDPDAATVAVLRSALRYASLYAKTRHIGPPRRVYDSFFAWGVRNEGFASPFNARVLGRPGARFFSACADVDAPFGSAGSFFGLDEPVHPGAWCLDPPFLTETIRRVEAVIARWRRLPNPPAVLLVIPWAHPLLHEPDESVRLTAGQHVYEGLAGTVHPLPVDVAIHRFGEMPGFDAGEILAGYTAPSA